MPQLITKDIIIVESLLEPDDVGLAMVMEPLTELLHWHYKLTHLGFRTFQTLAKLGVLPKRVSTVMPPTCAACIYGSAHKQSWQMQAQASNVHILLITSPAQ